MIIILSYPLEIRASGKIFKFFVYYANDPFFKLRSLRSKLVSLKFVGEKTSTLTSFCSQVFLVLFTVRRLVTEILNFYNDACFFLQLDSDPD